MFDVFGAILEIVGEFLFYLLIRVLEFFIDLFAWLFSILFNRVSNIFKRNPKRWNRLNDKHQAKLKEIKEKRILNIKKRIG